MEDKVKDGRTGLTIDVVANLQIPGDYSKKLESLRKMDTEFARLLGAILSNPSDKVSSLASNIAVDSIRSILKIARMDEDELEAIAEKILTAIKEAIENVDKLEPPHSFSDN